MSGVDIDVIMLKLYSLISHTKWCYIDTMMVLLTYLGIYFK